MAARELRRKSQRKNQSIFSVNPSEKVIIETLKEELCSHFSLENTQERAEAGEGPVIETKTTLDRAPIPIEAQHTIEQIITQKVEEIVSQKLEQISAKFEAKVEKLSSTIQRVKVYLGNLSTLIVQPQSQPHTFNVNTNLDSLRNRLRDLEDCKSLGQCQIRRHLMELEQLLEEGQDDEYEEEAEEEAEERSQDDTKRGYIDAMEAFDDGAFEDDA